jgi:hypothetical protein
VQAFFDRLRADALEAEAADAPVDGL